MPTYQFVCPECEAGFTAIQSLSEAVPEPECETCKIKMDRVYGLQTIIFRGSGWAKNDS